MTKRFGTMSHRTGFIRMPQDSWGVAPVTTIKVKPEAIAHAATAPLEELVEDREALRRQRALEIIEAIKSSETRLDLHHTAATIKLRKAIAALEDLGGYQLFGHTSFQRFWNEFFPNCGNHQRALVQSQCLTVLRLLGLPIDCEAPTTNALRVLVRIGIRDATTINVKEQKGLYGRYQLCHIDRAFLIKEAWQRACEIAVDGIPTERETLKAVRELSKIYPELAPPKSKKNPLEPQVQELTLQLEQANSQIKALEQINQELREQLAREVSND